MIYDDPGKLSAYPNKPGLWKYYCEENAYKADYAAVCIRYDSLNKNDPTFIIHTDFQSGDNVKSFSDALTNCSWEFIG